MPIHQDKDLLAMLRKPLLTLQETADLLKLSEATLRGLIKAEEVRAIRIGREWRIAVRDLEEFLDARANRAPAAYQSEPLSSPQPPVAP
jgi:excisionase family DNA binding protein